MGPRRQEGSECTVLLSREQLGEVTGPPKDRVVAWIRTTLVRWLSWRARGSAWPVGLGLLGVPSLGFPSALCLRGATDLFEVYHPVLPGGTTGTKVG